MRGLSAKGRAGLRIVSAVLGLGILSGRMAPAEGAEPMTDHRVVILWPGGAPGAKGNDPEQDIPTLTAWLAKPEAAMGDAVVVCPGGGDGMPASDHEGRQVAEWLKTRWSVGVRAQVPAWPALSPPGHAPDTGRAIRTVRALGQKWGVDPRRIARAAVAPCLKAGDSRPKLGKKKKNRPENQCRTTTSPLVVRHQSTGRLVEGLNLRGTNLDSRPYQEKGRAGGRARRPTRPLAGELFYQRQNGRRQWGGCL
jgi:hypothetical protein